MYRVEEVGATLVGGHACTDWFWLGHNAHEIYIPLTAGISCRALVAALTNADIKPSLTP